MANQRSQTLIASHLGPRAFILAALLGAICLLLGGARNAGASHPGTFTLDQPSYSGTEGGVVQVLIVAPGRHVDSPARSVGFIVTPGTALAGSDYNGPTSGCIAFAPGSTTASVQITFTLEENLTVEPNESFTITLTSGGDCDVVALDTPASAPITILDNDGPGVWRFGTSTSSVTESTVTHNVQVIRTGDLSTTETIQCDLTGGTATVGVDFNFADPQTLTFAPTVSSQNCAIGINEDPTAEGDETIVFALAGDVAGGTSIDTSADDHTVTINDDDGQTVQFSLSDYQVNESAGSVTVTVTRTNPSGTASVNWDLSNGSNVSTADYTDANGTLTFTGSDASESFTVNITDDILVEGAQVINVTLSGAVGATIAGTNPATITIADDEVAGVLQFSAVNYNVDEGNTVILTVNRTGGSSGVVTVQYQTVSGTATAADYTPESDTITFNDGVTSRTITIDTTEDLIVENTNQSFSVQLVNPVGASLGTINEASVTILDDDGAAPTVTSVSPNAGPTAGGTIVTITGTNFFNVTTVTFGGVAATSIVVNSSTSITALSPARAAGTVDVRVTTPSGVTANTAADDFTYSSANAPTITSVSPTSGLTSGGASVTITGTNLTGATSVTFGGTAATSFVVNSATSITAVTPAKAAGTVEVIVTTPGGSSATAGSANDFAFVVTQPTTSYTLTRTWTLIAFLGKDNILIASALGGVESGVDNPQTNNVLGLVTAVAFWDAPNQRYLFWFPGGASVPGANDITTFRYGMAYWIAVTTTTGWAVITGP